MFGIFTLTISGNSLYFVFLNTTTVENLSRTIKVHTFAVHTSHPLPLQTVAPFQTITYPLVPASQEHRRDNLPASRNFVILHTQPGENPWDLGLWRNFKSVMGDHPLDWLLPLRYSPICDHNNEESEFPLGPVMQRLKEEADLCIRSAH